MFSEIQIRVRLYKRCSIKTQSQTVFEEYVFVHLVRERIVKICSSMLMLQVHPRPAFKDISRSFVVCIINHSPFPLLCVVHLPVFFSFSMSLFVSCTVSGVAKRARCFLKGTKLIVSARDIVNLDSANKQYKFTERGGSVVTHETRIREVPG